MPRLPSFFPFPLFFAAATACAELPAGHPNAEMPSFDSSSCSKFDYPHEAVRRGEQGVTMLAFLVGADGGLRRVELLDSSGSAVLDTAAQTGLKNCLFRPAVVQGRAVERWLPVDYAWTLEPPDPISAIGALLDVAATKGRAAGEFALYKLLRHGAAKRSAEQQVTLVSLLRRSAAGGHCSAKFVLGQYYEAGTPVKQDLQQARDWYEQAANCGNPVAADKLKDMPPSR